MDNLTELLMQMGGGAQDSRSKLLFEYLKQKSAADEAEVETTTAAEQERRRRLERQALSLLRRKNLELSAAFGACPCWGEHAGCPRCGGRGAPGWRAPDEALFMQYVEPVLRRLGIVIDREPSH